LLSNKRKRLHPETLHATDHIHALKRTVEKLLPTRGKAIVAYYLQKRSKQPAMADSSKESGLERVETITKITVGEFKRSDVWRKTHYTRKKIG